MYTAGSSPNHEIISSEQTFPDSSAIHEVLPVPGLLARNGTLVDIRDQYPPLFEDLTKALFDLDKYDIRIPGVGCIATRDTVPDPRKNARVFSTTLFVRGYNMHEDMGIIPLNILLDTVDQILAYYENMRKDYSNRLYLTDVSLRQCIFGIPEINGLPIGTRPDRYFIDHEPRLSNIKTAERDMRLRIVKSNRAFRGLTGLDDDLAVLKETFPDQSFNNYSQRLLNLADSMALSYWTPTAWEHVNSI